MNIYGHTRIQRTGREISTSSIGHDTVMLDAENDRYIGLNSTGTVIWQQLESPCSVDELIDQLTSRFEVNREVCEEATIKYLQQMIEQGLVSVSDPA